MERKEMNKENIDVKPGLFPCWNERDTNKDEKIKMYISLTLLIIVFISLLLVMFVINPKMA